MLSSITRAPPPARGRSTLPRSTCAASRESPAGARLAGERSVASPGCSWPDLLYEVEINEFLANRSDRCHLGFQCSGRTVQLCPIAGLLEARLFEDGPRVEPRHFADRDH